MEPGDTIRFRVNRDYPGATQPCDWILARIVRVQGDKVFFAYWDIGECEEPLRLRDQGNLETNHGWELYTPVIDPVALQSKLWTCSPTKGAAREQVFLPLPWTLGECVGTVWINRHTNGPFRVDHVGLDRFFNVHLYEGKVGHFGGWTLGIWRDVPHVGEVYAIEHYDRLDALPETEQIRRLYLGLGRIRAEKKVYDLDRHAIALLEGALHDLGMSTDTLPLEALNVEVKSGQQLRLF
jgi:hypothetical protein